MLKYKEKMERLADWIKRAEKMVVLTGAGVSTESGIPDFRGEKGIYLTEQPLSVSDLNNNYESFFDFCKRLFAEFKNCQPNQAHQVLANWEELGLLKAVITQNVDGLHQKAGSENVLELHGSMETSRCMDCGRAAETIDFFAKKRCKFCQGQLRPDIVLFGDMLPEDELNQAFRLFQKADLVLVIGSSLKVNPACELPFLSGDRKVLINKEELSQEAEFELTIYGEAGRILKEVDQLI